MPTPAIDIEAVSYTYPGSPVPAIERVSLRVEESERLGILGPNGGGKSTLVKLMLGMLSPDAGGVRVFGESPLSARKRGVIGYVAQRAELELALPISVREAVTLGPGWRISPWKRTPREIRERVQEMLQLVGCEGYADRHIGALSGGQLQRVLVARALAAGAKILVLDEPMVGIDASGQEKFAELWGAIHRRLRVTVVIVSHDLRAIVAGSDRVACLARRLHSHTSPQGLTPQILAELFTHDVAGLRGVLGGMHVHAHSAGEPCSEHHDHGPPAGLVPLNVAAPAPRPAEKGESPRGTA